MSKPEAPRLPRRWDRIVVRAGASGAWTAGLFFVWLLGQLVAGWSTHTRNLWRATIFRAWGRGLCALCGVKLVVHGAPPRHGTFLVANHLSFVDIWVMAATTGGRFVSMAEVARWPVIGFMAARLGTIFIRRERRREIPQVNAAIASALAQGDTVLVFPEGGNSQGEAVREFKPSLLEPAAAGGHAVAWCTLRYDTHDPAIPAAWAVCWVRTGFAAQLLRLLSLRMVEATVRFGDGSMRGTDRRELALRLRERVAEAFVPLAQAPEGLREAPLEHGVSRNRE
jgi:1-acyl-sn-glycerol-3-phosphate acyltransferase